MSRTKITTRKAEGQRILILDRIGELLAQPDAEKWVAGYFVKPRRPMNACYANSAVKRYYRGINYLALSFAASAYNYGSDHWLTFKQAKGLGGSVRKGERGMPVAFLHFPNPEEREEDEDAEDGAPKLSRKVWMTTYTLFNIEQTEGITINDEEDDEEKTVVDVSVPSHAKVDHVLKSMKNPPAFKHVKQAVPHYTPYLDEIAMPPHEQFTSIDTYDLSRLHEFAHATGHPSRLNRKMIAKLAENGKGSIRHERGLEEMTVELAVTMIGAELDIKMDNLAENASRYVRSWNRALNDSNVSDSLLKAAQDAQKIRDYIIP